MSIEAMTEDELKAIEARANAATPGPWRSTWQDERPSIDHETDNLEVDDTIVEAVGREGFERVVVGTLFHDEPFPACREPDAAFIASARSDVPRLVAEVRRLRAANARLNARAQAAEGVILRAGLGNDFENVDPSRLRSSVTERATFMAAEKIRQLEAQIAATAEQHREDQRRSDELANVPG